MLSLYSLHPHPARGTKDLNWPKSEKDRDDAVMSEIWASVMHPDKEHTKENFISRHFVCFNSWQCLDKDKGGNSVCCGV